LRAVVPGVQGGCQLQRGKTSTSTSYTGTSDTFNDGFNWPLAMGRTLSADDLHFSRRVCVLGERVYQDLFQGDHPLGEEIKLNGERFTVIGVLQKRVRFGQDEGNRVFIPYTTAQKRLTGFNRLAEITLFVEELEAVEEVVAAAKRVLQRRHEHGGEFQIETSQQEMDSANNVIRIMQQVAGGIAGISLLVGGIGIMNILLVSVAERTREIGIRKALGAKPRHILGQFLAESVVLSMAGGVLGILAGIGFGLAIALAIQQFAPGSPFSSIVSGESVLWAVVFASAVGIFFGVYPAYRAAKLDPVEALRHE
jgi:putative ABC transport system permease protein